MLKLKGPCVGLIQAISTLSQRPTAKKEVVQALEHLHKALQEVASSPGLLDAKLSEYAFVPISHVLRASRTVPVRALELSLNCVSILLRTGWKQDLSPDLAGQLLILFTFLANPSSAENGISATSEELQAAAFECIAALLASASSTSKGRQALTSTSNIPALGKAVLVMLDTLNESRSNNVKLKSLAALKTLSSVIDDLDALASFLPRLVSTFTKILTPSSSNRAGFRLLEQGLDTLSLLFLRMLSDQQTKGLPQASAGDKQDETEKVLRTSAWLRATAGQIKIALANIIKLRRHDKKEVRHALLRLCLTVIQECQVSLSKSISLMVETLVVLAADIEGQGTAEADLRALLSTDSKLADLLRESLHGWVISLPRLMHSKDDLGRRHTILQISVALRLLNAQQVDITKVDNLLAFNLRDGVASVLSESKKVGGITEPAAQAQSIDTSLVLGGSSTEFQPLSLQSKGQNETMQEFKLLLEQIARSDSADAVARDLVNSVTSGSEENRLASYWLSLNILKALSSHGDAVDEFLDFGAPSVRSELLDELYTFSVSLLTDSESDSDLHWRFQSLALEVIAMQAKEHKEDFRVELTETLYPVLHLLGTSNTAVRNHAITCLNIISSACGYTNASDLIVSNVDYLVNAVGLKLNYHDISPQAPQVLLMMMRLCGPSLLPYLDDLVGSMFSALERFHGYPKLVELLFAVLRGMAEEGVKTPQLAITDGVKKAQKTNCWMPMTVGDVVEVLRTIKKEELKRDEEHWEASNTMFPQKPWKDEEQGSREESSEEQGSNDVDRTDAEPPPPAPQIFDILLKISQLTQHYLTSSSPSLRTSLLSLLNTTIPALAKHDNSFLPLINTLWPVLVPRLDDTEAYVVANALDIVGVMCASAGNFMKSRIESLWEMLKTIHNRTVRASKKHTTQTRQTHTSLQISQPLSGPSGGTVGSNVAPTRQEYYVDAPTRLIYESLVRLLCSISEHVTVRDEKFDELLDMLDPVLERDDVRSALARRNPDALWLRELKKTTRQGGATEGMLKGFIKKPATAEKPGWQFVEIAA